MRVVRDWPFSATRLELTQAEIRALNRAADIADKAAAFCPPESEEWYEWKRVAEIRMSEARRVDRPDTLNR